MLRLSACILGSLLAVGIDEPSVPPSDWNPCGPNALYVCAQISGLKVPLEQIRDLCQADGEGRCSVADLVRAAKTIGFTYATPVHTTLDKLSRFGKPVIVRDNQQDPPHFVAILGERGEKLLVVSPPLTHHWIDKTDAARGWEGHAVLLSTTPIPELSATEQIHQSRLFPLVAGLAVGGLAGPGLLLLRRRRPQLPETGTRHSLSPS